MKIPLDLSGDMLLKEIVTELICVKNNNKALMHG